MKFSHKYKLNRDLPNYKKGWKLGWSGIRERFFPYKPSPWKSDFGKESHYLDFDHQGFTVETVKDTEWFTPIGTEVDFTPKFPDKNDIYKFIHLGFETRLVDDVDECRSMNKLFGSGEFDDNLYEFVKSEYNRFYGFSLSGEDKLK